MLAELQAGSPRETSIWGGVQLFFTLRFVARGELVICENTRKHLIWLKIDLTENSMKRAQEFLKGRVAD